MCQYLEYAYRNLHALTDKQKNRIEILIAESKKANKWFYDDLEEELFDIYHTRAFRYKINPHTGMLPLGARTRGCRNIEEPAFPCSCHPSERANNHGYIDESNWDYECWGPFSAGSD